MRKISRREFLKVGGKIALGAILISTLPLKLFGNDAYLRLIETIGKKFAIPLKPFKRGDLFRKHELAG